MKQLKQMKILMNSVLFHIKLTLTIRRVSGVRMFSSELRMTELNLMSGGKLDHNHSWLRK